jgi:hypothetical protein
MVVGRVLHIMSQDPAYIEDALRRLGYTNDDITTIMVLADAYNIEPQFLGNNIKDAVGQQPCEMANKATKLAETILRLTG